MAQPGRRLLDFLLVIILFHFEKSQYPPQVRFVTMEFPFFWNFFSFSRLLQFLQSRAGL